MGKIWRPRRPAKAPPEAAAGLKDAEAVAVGKMWRPRRSAKAVGVKAAKGVAVIAVDAEVLVAPVVAAARGGEKGPLEDGSAVCPMDALGGVPVTTRQEAVGVKDAKGVVVAKMWRPRRPAKAPLEVVGVKDAVDGEVEASVLGFPVVAAARGGEKGPLEDAIAVCRMDALDGVPVTTRQEAVGVKDAEGVAVGKMRRSRRPTKVPLEAGGVKDAQGAAVGKMWRPRRPAKAPLEAVGVKDAGEVAVITVNRKAEESILGAPVVVADGGGEKGPLEEGTMVCLIDALDWAPVIAMTQQEALGVKDAEEVAVEKMRGPRQPVKAPLEAVGVKDAEGVELIVIDEEVEPLVLGVPVAAAAGGGEKGSLEDGIVVCRMDALAGAPVITTDEKEQVSVHDGIVVCWMDALAGAPVITTDEKEEVSVQDGTVVCRMDALDGDPVITTDEKEEVSMQDGIVVYRMDALDGAPVITTDEKEEVSVQDGIVACWMDALDGAPVITTDEKEEVSVQDEIVVCRMDALHVAPVITTDEKEEVSVQDEIVVCRMDALHGAPVITTDEKEEVSVQGDPVFPTVDQKVDALVVEGVKAITVKGNGKEEKGEEGIKWLKHYSTAQSILIVGDGDFSFSLALATAFGSAGNLVATSLDSYGALMIKYGKAESNVRELKRLGATVLHDVDAKTMKLHSYLEMRRFDRIVFNFPHAGFQGREYLLRVIRAHKKLVHGFLVNARQLLRPYGEIHLSHKTGSPYDSWDIEQLAYDSCLIMVRKVDFSHEDYPGYNQKKGDGVTCDESFPLGPCCTFMFCVGDLVKPKQAHGGSKKRKKRNRVGSISSYLGDSKFYPGISGTDMVSPFDLHPAWPQPHFPPVHLPIAFDPCPFGVAEVEHLVNCYGTSFYHQDMVQPTHLVQPWCQEGPPIEQPWTPEEYQSLQREYEIHRLLALSLEDHYMESVREAGDVGKVDSSLWRSVN